MTQQSIRITPRTKVNSNFEGKYAILLECKCLMCKITCENGQWAHFLGNSIIEGDREWACSNGQRNGVKAMWVGRKTAASTGESHYEKGSLLLQYIYIIYNNIYCIIYYYYNNIQWGDAGDFLCKVRQVKILSDWNRWNKLHPLLRETELGFQLS